MSTIVVSAFRWVPPFALGLMRDLRVRWALAEAGLPYEVLWIGPEDHKPRRHRGLRPLIKIPTYEEDGLTLSETGAIVLHIAERSVELMPADPDSRSRTKVWAFSASNRLEPVIQNFSEIDLLHARDGSLSSRRAMAAAAVRQQLQSLVDPLQQRDYLEGPFTAADLLVVTALRLLRHTDIVEQFPVLEAYRHRCELRPAFKKAIAAQMAPFAKNALARW